VDCKEQRHANLRSEFFWISSWQRTWIYLTLLVCYNFHFCLFSWQMCGLVGWLCMLCWWEHIHSRTRRTQRISGKQSMYYILSCVCLSSIQVVLLFSFYCLWISCCLPAENNGSSIQDPRLCPHISGLQTSPLSHIRCKSNPGMDE